MNQRPWEQDATKSALDQAPARRLHPLSPVLRLLGHLPQVVFGLFAASFVIDRDDFWPILGVATAALLVTIVVSWVAWLRLSYQISDDGILITSGLISRNTRTLPFERIQDVNLEQKLAARLLGLAVVKLETGSAGGAEEGKLDAVSLAEAERLRDLVRSRRAGPAAAVPTGIASGEATTDDAEETGSVLFAMDLGRVLAAGLYNFSLVFVAAIGAVIQNFDFLLPGSIYDPDFWIDLVGSNPLIEALTFGARIAVGLMLLGALLVGGLITGVVRTLLRDYGFQLERTPSGFRRQRGLLTLTDVVIPRHRIQAAQIDTGPIRRRRGWYHLRMQSLASDGEKEASHSIAPLAQRDEIAAILAETPMRWTLDEQALNPVAPALWKIEGAALTLLLLIGGLVGGFAVSRYILLALILLPLTPMVAWLHWRRHRYALNEQQLYVTAGIWRQRLTLIPTRRIQSVDLVQGVLGRLMGVATLEFGVAGGRGIDRLRIRALPVSEAWTLRAQLLASSLPLR